MEWFEEFGLKIISRVILIGHENLRVQEVKVILWP